MPIVYYLWGFHSLITVNHMNRIIENRLFALLRPLYSTLPADTITIAIYDTLSEQDSKLLSEGIDLTPDEHFRRAVRGAKWKLSNIKKLSSRFAPLEEAEDVADSFDIVHVMETEEVIDEALKALTDKERAILLMQSSLNLPYARMAKICGVTTNAIKGVLANAKRKMQMVGNPPPSIIVPT